jgi:inositol phosphorylceramide mannosyltransferase catalytic subunit
MKLEIPLRIIQTAKTGDLPLFFCAAAVNVKLLNPEFEYLFFDDKQVDDFIDDQFPQYKNIFNSFRFPICKYDFFRYLAIYRYGGFYLDLDVFLAKGLAELADLGCVFPFEELNASRFLRREYGMDWGVGNFAFGAAAGHPFMLAVVENCVRAQQDPSWLHEMMRGIPRWFHAQYYVLNTTGPGLIARTLAEYPRSSQEVEVLFPDNVCDRSTWYRFGTYGVHLMRGNWRKQKGVLRNRLYAVWSSWMEGRFFQESVKLGPQRALSFRKRL